VGTSKRGEFSHLRMPATLRLPGRCTPWITC